MVNKYRDGKISPDDRGAFRVVVVPDPDRQLVLIDFTNPTRWIGLSVDEAIALAEAILAKAKEVERHKPRIAVAKTD